MEEDKDKAFTLSVEVVYDILNDVQDNFEIAKELLTLYLPVENHSDYACFLLSEILWTSYSTQKILEKEIESAVLTEDKQFIVLEESMMMLQSLLLSRQGACNELTKLSISVKKN